MRKVLPEEVLTMDENEFVLLNEKLVHSVCQRIYSDRVKRDTGLDYEDLFQVGLAALVKSKRGFKPEYGWQFSTYAMPKIRGEILRHLLLNRKIHVSRPILEVYFKISKAGLLQEDDEVVAKELGLSVKQVKRAKSLRMEVSSINELISEENGDATVEDWLATEQSAADVAEDNLVIHDFLATLTPMERSVWEAYRDTNCGNQVEVAKIIGISQVQVSRIMKKVYFKAEAYGKKMNQEGVL